MVLTLHDYDRHKSAAKPQRDRVWLDVALLNVAHDVPVGVRRSRAFIAALNRKAVGRIVSADGFGRTVSGEGGLSAGARSRGFRIGVRAFH